MLPLTPRGPCRYFCRSSLGLPSPQSYSQAGTLGQVVIPSEGESWPRVAQGQPSRPWLSEAVFKRPPAAAWCKFPQRRAGRTLHRWDGREEWKGARGIYRGSATAHVTVKWASRSLWDHLEPTCPSERGLPRFPAGVWAKHSVSRRGLGGPRSQPTMYQARYSHIPKDLGNLDCSGTPRKLGH